MGLHSAIGANTRGQKHSAKVMNFPAPVKGINTRQQLAAPDPHTCVYTYNLMPSEQGMRVRPGYREWVIGITDGSVLGVHTLIPIFNHITDTKLLFAATNEGIWDITTYATTIVPATHLKITFANTSADAGYGVFTTHTNAAGTTTVFYADSLNGLFEYDVATDTWIQSPNPTGAHTSALDIDFISAHHHRLWFTVQNDTAAYYFDLAAKAGNTTAFYLDGKFKHGGAVKGVFNWNHDGGSGPDDYLVFIGSAGDVIPYAGTDPDNPATWTTLGTFFVGDMPKGKTIATQTMGELYLLSVNGVISMSNLVRGGDARIGDANTLSYQIARNLRDDMRVFSDDRGWDIRFLPSEGQIVVVTPDRGAEDNLQYVYDLNMSAWGYWRGLDISAIEMWQGRPAFGDATGKVFTLDTTTDGATIAGVSGEPIPFSILLSYTNLSRPGVFKIAQFARADWAAKTEVSYETKVLYDFSANEFVASAFATTIGDDTWDVGQWDIALWGASVRSAYNKLEGVSGLGRSLATALRGEAIDEALLLNVEAIWTEGGGV